MDRVTDMPETLARPADPAQANDYDSLAEVYSASALAGETDLAGQAVPGVSASPVGRCRRAQRPPR